MIKSRCGIVCDPVKCKEAFGFDCAGCPSIEKAPWGDCDIKICCEKQELERFVGSLGKPVDCLINNACTQRGDLLSGCSYEDFEYVRRPLEKPAKILPSDNPKTGHGFLVMQRKTDLLVSRVVGFSFRICGRNFG